MSIDAGVSYRRPNPLDEDWQADYDPSYDNRTQEGGDWFGLTDDEIEQRQIQEFLGAEELDDFYQEEQRRIAREDEDNR